MRLALALAFCMPIVGAVDAGEPVDPQLVAAHEWFFLPYPESSESAPGEIKLGTMRDEKPEFPGTKVFWVDKENRPYPGRTYFKTRMARPQDLVLGRRVVYPLGEVKTQEDKRQMSWGYRRLVDLVDAPRGQVIVDGHTNPIVDASILRVLVGGEPDPVINMSGKEDLHHFHPEHWLVATEARDPGEGGVEAKMALAIRAPATPGEEGVFLVIDSGAIVTSKYAYRTRPASRAELATGRRVAVFGASMDLPDRDVAYRTAWWVGPLGLVTPAVIKLGRSTVRPEMIRVVQ